jgi:hypothetical protein
LEDKIEKRKMGNGGLLKEIHGGEKIIRVNSHDGKNDRIGVDPKQDFLPYSLNHSTLIEKFNVVGSKAFVPTTGMGCIKWYSFFRRDTRQEGIFGGRNAAGERYKGTSCPPHGSNTWLQGGGNEQQLRMEILEKASIAGAEALSQHP